MMDAETLFDSNVMRGTNGVTAGQKLEIKALWSWCRVEYEVER